MKIPIYQVDAFTSHVFSGNPAAVCILDSWIDDRHLQSIAAENNWSVVMETQQPEAVILMAQKGEQHLVLNVSSDGGKTIRNITMGKRN